ncbi:MAG: PKD domain-containing protein [Thermoplasmatales archaeon]|nr:MAG: PKD domain-containing protein [Thermoplasmatales archaeon]
MKSGKILILAMVVSSILAVSIPSVMAIDEYKNITDGEGDVIDLNTGDVVEENQDVDVDNIDITELTYDREDKSVTFTLKVKGEIENRGNISDMLLFSGYGDPGYDYSDIVEFDIDSVGYIFGLVTSNETYHIVYVNEKCRLIYESTFASVNLTDDDFSVEDDTLSISFEVNSSEETYEDVLVSTMYLKLKFNLEDLDEGGDIDDFEDLMSVLTDEAPNQPLEVESFAPNLGEVGISVKFEALALFGQPPHSFNWDFGDGLTSSEKNPTHAYDKPGEYEWILTVTDNSGASVNNSGTIEIISTEENGTPGFELVIVIATIILILLWRRK